MIEKAPKFEIDENRYFSQAFINLLKNFNKETVNKIEEEYLYWDKIKYLPLSDETSKQDMWEYVKSTRFNNQKNLYLNGKKNLWFNYNENNYLKQKLHYLDFNFGAGLQKEKLLTELEKQQYLKNALMEEAIFSSKIEGATTTRIKAK